MIIYLGCLLPDSSCGSPGRIFGKKTAVFPKMRPGAALHASKDLAVSPLLLPGELIPIGMPVCFRFGRLCSHLASRTHGALPKDGSYPLLFLTCFRTKTCPDFPPLFKNRGDHLRGSIMQHNEHYCKSRFISSGISDGGSVSVSPTFILSDETKKAFISRTNRASTGGAKIVCG